MLITAKSCQFCICGLVLCRWCLWYVCRGVARAMPIFGKVVDFKFVFNTFAGPTISFFFYTDIILIGFSVPFILLESKSVHFHFLPPLSQCRTKASISLHSSWFKATIGQGLIWASNSSRRLLLGIPRLRFAFFQLHNYSFQDVTVKQRSNKRIFQYWIEFVV